MYSLVFWIKLWNSKIILLDAGPYYSHASQSQRAYCRDGRCAIPDTITLEEASKVFMNKNVL